MTEFAAAVLTLSSWCRVGGRTQLQIAVTFPIRASNDLFIFTAYDKANLSRRPLEGVMATCCYG